jgi:hypothetical protein
VRLSSPCDDSGTSALGPRAARADPPTWPPGSIAAARLYPPAIAASWFALLLAGGVTSC